MIKQPIPWIFTDSPIMKKWSWKTAHFDARILSMAGDSSLVWEVVDVSGGAPSILDTSETLTFVQAQNDILEIIGKSYPPILGYWAYARELATTFLVKNGEPFDFGPYEGREVIVEYFNKHKPHQPVIVMGILHVTNYNITLRPANKDSIVIPPSFIISVRKEGERSAYGEIKEKKTPRSRILHEEWRVGCTGAPGYAPNTLIHNQSDPYCPIHDS